MKEHLHEYFDIGQESPHMLIACKVRPEKKAAIPATVHVDDSCRVQSVGPDNNEKFYNLLRAFRDRTGCPVLLNTSFNVKGQPIVQTPEQAIACFQGTQIDVLVLGDFLVEKRAPTPNEP
jgi:carbamoyltransferase